MSELSYPRLENGRIIYGPPAAPVAPLISINDADVDELVAAGLTEALASRVIAYRDEHGPFESVDDLTSVPRFGEKAVTAIRDRVKV